MFKNNKGQASLVAVIMAGVCGLIIFTALSRALVTYMRTYNYYVKNTPPIQIQVLSVTPNPTPLVTSSPTPTPMPGAPLLQPVQGAWIPLLNLNECKQADSTYWVARTAQRQAVVYTDSHCHTALGTLDAVTNGAFTNPVGKTSWQLSRGEVANPNNLTLLILSIP